MTINDFWEKLLIKEKEKGKNYFENIQLAQNYFAEYKTDFAQAFKEIEEYIPKNTNLDVTLFLMFGYLIGYLCNSLI